MQKSNKPALKIRAVRESRGYTQEYMAEMMGICQSTYAHLESGKTRLSIDRLVMIAELLEVEPAALIEIKPFRNEKHLSAGMQSPSPLTEMDPSAKRIYETLVEELRAEIRFLRSLVRPVEG